MLSWDTFNALLEPALLVTDPQKRVFWAYLLCSAVLALWVLSRQAAPIAANVKKIFTLKFWLHPSFLLDVKLVFLNNAIWVLLIAPLFGSQIALALATKHVLTDMFGQGDMISTTVLNISIAYTIVFFVCDDFSRFIVHFAYHKWPLLWRFHAVHHSATLLTPLTLYRVHFVEMFFNACRSIFVAGIVGGLFIYCVDGKISPLQILGASIFSLAFNIAGANLRHSHIYLSYGFLERWILSPAQHQIHHSANPQHFDKNFGVMIALWDRLFSTYAPSKNQTVESVGLGKPVEQNIKTHLLGIK